MVEPNGHRVLPVYSEGASAPELFLYDETTPRLARDRALYVLREDRRRLRSHLRVLHHTETARRLSLPFARVDT